MTFEEKRPSRLLIYQQQWLLEEALGIKSPSISSYVLTAVVHPCNVIGFDAIGLQLPYRVQLGNLMFQRHFLHDACETEAAETLLLAVTCTPHLLRLCCVV